MFSDLWSRLCRRKRATNKLTKAPLTGDGIGYPVEYEGKRIVVDNAFLTKCKRLGSLKGAFRVNESTVVKIGDENLMNEAAAMRFVAEKTSIPVPKVLDAYMQEEDGRGVIFMEYIEGEELHVPWASYSPEQKESIIAQLRKYLDELRAIQGDGITISGINGSPCFDQFFHDEKDAACGPFATEADFHSGLAAVLRARSTAYGGWCLTVSRFLASLTGHEILFTHGDLAPRNILLRDGMVVAILDWEFAGFYPDYWEYIKCFLWNDWGSEWVTESIPDRILTPKLPELAYLLHARNALREW